jgi:small-conductance mechanosensitive channel
MIMGIQFSSRQDKVASLQGRLADLDAQVAAQQERMKARESEIRSLQVEQAQRSDRRGHRSFGFPAPQSPAGLAGLHKVECEIVGHRNTIIDIKGTIRRLERQRRVLLSEIKYEENILAASAPQVRDRRPVPRL